MPYLDYMRRHVVQQHGPGTAGDLNYLIATLIDSYVDLNGLSYQTIADITAAVHGAMNEFEDRIVRPYEDAKMEENGDVFLASEAALEQALGSRRVPVAAQAHCGAQPGCGMRYRN